MLFRLFCEFYFSALADFYPQRLRTFAAMLHDEELETNWKKVLTALEPQFGGDLDLQAILFIIGIQELGKGFVKLKKDEKLNVMHIAVCTLLEPLGYYLFDGTDSDGWPHWTFNTQLPHLKPAQQSHLMRQAVVDYFKKMEVI